MSHCRAALLSDRSVLRVTGPDAHKLLQGVITNNLDRTQDGAAIHAGLLSPQGKILFDFFVVTAGDGYLIEVSREKAAELVKRLGFYRLRAKVEIAELRSSAWPRRGTARPIRRPAPSLMPIRGWPRLESACCCQAATTVADLGCEPASEDDYHAMRIKLGVPEGGRDYAFGDAFPHDALFDQLNGVDFKKGCFVGQEVVSRMQHRGTARKRIVPVEGDAPLQSGGEIEAGGLPIGPIGSVNGIFGLALVRLDRVEDAVAKGNPLAVDGTRVTLRRPSFATFDVPTGVPA
ncbi:folate-binding protein [Methyloceanibacter superfactus]|uniref:CAF17-like 4Fe-4S cluster assembly/insertion protein YgfZ n=1 Tax=Methyloceanibacter superfactus TaxID=1774969 RepID=UPI000A3F4AEB